MAKIVVTGSGSGIGAATAARLSAAGHTVLGIDLRGADIEADLGVAEGRRTAVEQCGDDIAGVVCCAGLGPLSSHQGGKLIAVNYFGAVDLLTGLRPKLTDSAAAVLVSSSSTSTQPGFPIALVDACLAGDEAAAVALGDAAGAINAYPASKLALAWWVRQEAVRDNWIGAGIRLNAVAPGMIDTPMTSGPDLDPNLAKALDYYPIPMGRRGRPDEIAGVIEFLLGATILCGSIVFADGGTDALLRQRDWPNIWELPRGADDPRAPGWN